VGTVLGMGVLRIGTLGLGARTSTLCTGTRGLGLGGSCNDTRGLLCGPGSCTITLRTGTRGLGLGVLRAGTCGLQLLCTTVSSLCTSSSSFSKRISNGLLCLVTRWCTHGSRQIVLGAVIVFNVVATLGGAPIATLGGVALSTLVA
jgi:hypothetical protein